MLRVAAVAVSLGAHAGGWLALGVAPGASAGLDSEEPSPVEYFAIAPPAATEPEPAREGSKPASHAANREPAPVKPRTPHEKPRAEEDSQASAPEPEGPLDLTGTTLSAASGAFALSAGNGAARAGPLTLPGRRREHERAPAKLPGASGRPARPAAPGAAPVASLSRRPVAPALDAALERNYPAAAREAQISGTATVRVRITERGVATATRVTSESHAGFGAACSRTVDGSRWSPPLDESGQPVATEVTYRCHFRVLR